jgi:hypothetical protein
VAWKYPYYGKGVGIDPPSFVVNGRNRIKLTLVHTLAGSWLMVFPFTFKLTGAAKRMNVAVVCGENSMRQLHSVHKPVYEIWVGLFGKPSKDFSLADNALTTIAGLSHDPTLEESEALEGVEGILFSRMSNNFGQILKSKFPKEFVISDENPSSNGSYGRVFLSIDFWPLDENQRSAREDLISTTRR